MNTSTAALAVFLCAFSVTKCGKEDRVSNSKTSGLSAQSANQSHKSIPKHLSFGSNPEIKSTSVSENTSFAEPLTFAFQTNLDCENASSNWIQIVDTETKHEVPGRILCEKNSLTFIPQMQMLWEVTTLQAKVVTSWIGLHPSGKYEASFSPHLGSTNTIPFSMTNLDFGTYWFNENGLGERRFENIPSPFVKSDAPTVVFFHGQQPGATAANIWRGNPFLKSFANETPENLLPLWKNKGYNIGIFFWEQFSDEQNPRHIEFKLWEKPNKDSPGIRFLTKDNKEEYLKTDQKLSDVLCNNYDSAIRDITAPTFRIVAHSAGTQLALHCIERHRESTQNLPDRLVLLDPYWSKSNKNYGDFVWTGSFSEEKLKWILKTKNVAVEQYKTSLLGGMIGDENLAFRKYTAFGRVWASFIPRYAFAVHHNYAIAWYFESMAHPLPVEATRGSGVPTRYLGAAATNEQIQALMNTPDSEKLHFFSTIGKGVLTSSSSDDTFQEHPGVSTW